MVNSAKRKQNITYAEGFEHGWGAFDNPDGTGWGGTHDVSVADPAHSPKSLIHTWHTAFVDAGYAAHKPFYVAQNHGFGGATQEVCGCDFQVSDGLGDPNQNWTDDQGMANTVRESLANWIFPVPSSSSNTTSWPVLSCYGDTWPRNETTGEADSQGVVCATQNPQGQYINLYDKEALTGPNQYDDVHKNCTLAFDG